MSPQCNSDENNDGGGDNKTPEVIKSYIICILRETD